MAISVTLNGTSYTLNQQNDNPPTGETLSDLLQALVDNANAVQNTGDIGLTTFSVPNAASTVSVVGVSFDTTTIRSAILSYSIYRSTSTNEVSECGQLYITYKSTAASWELSQTHVGDSQVTFSVTSSGQVQILPVVISGATYTGTLKLIAKAFSQ